MSCSKSASPFHTHLGPSCTIKKEAKAALCANMAPTVVMVVNTHQRQTGIERKGVSISCFPCKTKLTVLEANALRWFLSIPFDSDSFQITTSYKILPHLTTSCNRCLRISANINAKRMRSRNLGDRSAWISRREQLDDVAFTAFRGRYC